MLLSLLVIALQGAALSPSIECSRANAAPCATSIFFDSGEGSAIRPDWTGNLDLVAERLRGGGHARIDAFTDRSGSPAANRRIAERRAASVRSALLQRGVQPQALAIVAHGEADPLVPTADGVREPQNRRVDLTVIP